MHDPRTPPVPRLALLAALALLAGAVVGCPPERDDRDPWQQYGDDDASDDDDDDGTGDDDDDTSPATCSETFNLEVVVVDLWAQDGPPAEVVVHADGTQLAHVHDLEGPLLVPHDGAAAFEVDVLDAGELIGGAATLTWGGGALPGDLSLTQPSADSGARALHAFETREIDGRTCPVATLFIGLDHTWFGATAAPARTGNDVELLLNGEQAWERVHDDLQAASDEILHSTWFWMSDFELVRPGDHVHSTPSQRQEATAMEVLEDTAAHKRLLINRFYDGWDWIDVLYTDAVLRDHAETAGDGFEVILQPNGSEVPVDGEYAGQPADFCFRDRLADNPLYADVTPLDPPCAEMRPDDLVVPAASWHQKFFVIDDEVAFVGGMNTKTTDWDSHDHLVFDPRRMEFDADTDDREAVEAREELPDFGPRRDYMVRIEGPCVADVAGMFHERWEDARASDAAYAEYTTAMDEPPGPSAGAGELLAQVDATMPEPWAEMSISETWIKAIEAADSYIFIENQYFRSPILDDALIATLVERPWVTLVVLTWPIEPYEGGAKYTYLADQLFRDLVPDQYLLLQARAFDVVLEEGLIWDTRELYSPQIDVHSKLLIVDDRFLSVGSANFNNRSMLYDGETDLSVLDDVWVREQRQWLFENLVGPAYADQVGDDADANFALLQDVSAANEQIVDDWTAWIDDGEFDELVTLSSWYRPSGFLYPLDELPADYWFDVGPDLF